MRQAIVVYVAAIALTSALVFKLAARHGPFFTRPETIVDHVWWHGEPARRMLKFLPQAIKKIPPNVTVAAFQPAGGLPHDDFCFYTATGYLTHQFMVPPMSANPGTPKKDAAQYVIAVGSPFTNPDYELVETYSDGALYKMRQ